MVSTVPYPARRTAAPPADVHVTGRRIAATAVDGLIIGSSYGFMAALFGTITDRGGLSWAASMPAAANVAYGVLVIAYYLVLESSTGQTLGKMLAGIRVVDRRPVAGPGSGRSPSAPRSGWWTGSRPTSSRSSRCC